MTFYTHLFEQLFHTPHPSGDGDFGLDGNTLREQLDEYKSTHALAVAALLAIARCMDSKSPSHGSCKQQRSLFPSFYVSCRPNKTASEMPQAANLQALEVQTLKLEVWTLKLEI